MDAPFSVMAAAIADIAGWERSRIQLTHYLAARGQMEPPEGLELAGWRQRLVRVEAGGKLIRLLVPHEHQVRALEPLLARPTGAVPTFWDGAGEADR